MTWLGRLAGRRRIREAARRLGVDPCAENYLALAREHILVGDSQEVLRVCTEGLHEHPGDAELTRLAERARALLHDQRIKVLRSDLQIAPRPALWRELCELQLEVRNTAKAEEAAEAWWKQTHDPQALVFRARCRTEAFFENRRAEDGRAAYELAILAADENRSDETPLRLAFEIARRCGAWQEARTALARLLELNPGNPDLEQRFRAVQANLSEAISFERALMEVERSGEFKDDCSVQDSGLGDEVTVRSLLRELGSMMGVHGAVYVRGGTALVQGPQGPTADRTARTVRDVVQTSRATARRLALGNTMKIELEGAFGVLTVLPGERGTAAFWGLEGPNETQQEILSSLAGAVGGCRR